MESLVILFVFYKKIPPSEPPLVCKSGIACFVYPIFVLSVGFVFVIVVLKIILVLDLL